MFQIDAAREATQTKVGNDKNSAQSYLHLLPHFETQNLYKSIDNGGHNDLSEVRTTTLSNLWPSTALDLSRCDLQKVQ